VGVIDCARSYFGENLNFDERGEYSLKGIEGDWRLFAVDAS